MKAFSPIIVLVLTATLLARVDFRYWPLSDLTQCPT
jgi:hypothetical protein